MIKNKDEIAALIIEPIQGEGGDNHFRPEFLIELKKLSIENDFLLIYDEVQTGIGITGSMWAHQSFNSKNPDLQPDIISFGKKTQVCGIFASNRLDEVEDNVFSQSSRINSTWGGSLVDMVRFTLYLEIIENENLLENANKMGKELGSLLNKLQNGLRFNVSLTVVFTWSQWLHVAEVGHTVELRVDVVESEGEDVIGMAVRKHASIESILHALQVFRTRTAKKRQRFFLLFDVLL